MIIINKSNSNAKQAVLPILISDYLDICDPVLTFDRFMEEMDLEKYLKGIPKHDTGRPRYNPVSMLKTVLFGFMTKGYVSLRELEDSCKVNLRFMYLMDHETPSYRTFGCFINEVLGNSIEEIFNDINQKIFETEHVDLQHLYIDGSKFEANANKYSWVWKKATEKSRYRLFDKITKLLREINEEIACTGTRLCINTEYAPEYLKEAADKYAQMWQIDEATFVHGRGHHKTMQQRHYEKLMEYTEKLEEYVEKIHICGETTDKNYHEDPFRAVNFPIGEDGIMRCPNGKAFHLQYRKNVNGNAYGRQEEVYQCEDCAGCPYAEQCKKTDKNRTVRINRELTAMHQEVIENLESIQGALLRMNRSIQAEGTFGIMKNDRWYKRIVRRGMESVRLEVFLVSIGQSLYKFHNKKMRTATAA